MMRRGWNMWPKTALTLFCLVVFAASFIPRSDAEVEEAELVGGKANVDTSSDKDASHALVYDATNFRSEIDRRRMHFVMLFKSRFVVKTSTLVVSPADKSHGVSSKRILSLALCMLFKMCSRV